MRSLVDGVGPGCGCLVRCLVEVFRPGDLVQLVVS